MAQPDFQLFFGWELAVSGMNTMKAKKLTRRALLAAALTISAAADGRNARGFEQGQYQPGQPGQQISQGNTKVTQELNRMFQESGQQMPSMNAHELPNANVPTQGTVRPLQQNQAPARMNPTSQNQAPSQQATSSNNPGILGRFFGKFRGSLDGRAGNNSQDYRPPVPPDYKPVAPSTAATGNKNLQPQGQEAMLKQPQIQFTQNTQNQPPQNGARSETAQAYYGSKRPTAQAEQSSTQNSSPVRNGARSPIPPRSGSTVQSRNTASSVSSTPTAGGARTQYTQPGSAPGFMSTVGKATVIQKHPAAAPPSKDEFQDEFIQENRGGSITAGRAREKVKTTPAAASAAKDAADGFENTFLDSVESVDASEPLDLDSLIDIPTATPEPVQSVRKRADSGEPAASPTTQSAKNSAEAGKQSTTSNAEGTEAGKAFTDQQSEIENPSVREENPFTGVHLNTSDAEFFDRQVPTTDGDSGAFGVPVAPIEDFNSNLPAIDLPPVGDAESTEVDELNQTPATEVTQPVIADADEAPTVPADSADRGDLRPVADLPEAMSADETERLRQTAEQEQRQRQQRQIQVRAGQIGFKGFCPVALRERRELVESSEQFTSTFGLQTYSFSSAESKAAFDTDPSRYAPAAGGSDVVVLVNSGEEQIGQLDYSLWYRDRLYLFQSRETMTLFAKDPKRFASQY